MGVSISRYRSWAYEPVAALIATRLLVGAFEAGLYPTAYCIPLNILHSFRSCCPHRLVLRNVRNCGSVFWIYLWASHTRDCGTPAADEVKAYGIFHIDHNSIKNWQWLFIIGTFSIPSKLFPSCIESADCCAFQLRQGRPTRHYVKGLATAVLAIIAWFWLPYGPGSAWFLNRQDRSYAAERIRLDNALYIQHKYTESGVEKDTLTRRDAIETIKDWKLWYVLFFNILASVPGQAFSVFLPLVVKGLGYSSIKANLVSAYGQPYTQIC